MDVIVVAVMVTVTRVTMMVRFAVVVTVMVTITVVIKLIAFGTIIAR